MKAQSNKHYEEHEMAKLSAHGHEITRIIAVAGNRYRYTYAFMSDGHILRKAQFIDNGRWSNETFKLWKRMKDRNATSAAIMASARKLELRLSQAEGVRIE